MHYRLKKYASFVQAVIGIGDLFDFAFALNFTHMFYCSVRPRSLVTNGFVHRLGVRALHLFRFTHFDYTHLQHSQD